MLELSRLPSAIPRLGEHFASRRLEAYVVGGAVRDLLLQQEIADVDVAVAADTGAVAPQLAKFLDGRTVPLDDDRGTYRIMPRGEPRGLFVDLTPVAGDIQNDLGRRYFTIDAMAVPLAATGATTSLSVIDPFGGERDLKDRVIRVVSPTVFADDPGRLMRAARLAAQLGFNIARQTTDLIRRDAHLLDTVSPQRVREEFLKLLAQPNVVVSLRLLDGAGLLSRVVPELDDARAVGQPPEHHWDVFDHCIETVGQVGRLLDRDSSGAPDPIVDKVPRFEGIGDYFAQDASDGHSRLTLLKLTGLLHDIGKPDTKTIEPSGRIRFLGHSEAGAEVAAAALRRLRISRRGVTLVKNMVEHHLRPGQMAPEGQLPSKRATYRYYRDLGDVALDTLYLNLADYLAARGPTLDQAAWAAHCRVVAHILDRRFGTKKEKLPQRKLIDGHNLIQDLGLKPGPRFRPLLEAVQTAHGAGDVSTKEEALDLVKSIVGSGGGVA